MRLGDLGCEESFANCRTQIVDAIWRTHSEEVGKRAAVLDICLGEAERNGEHMQGRRVGEEQRLVFQNVSRTMFPARTSILICIF